MMLEAAQYTDNAFLTLTYSNDKLPADQSLVPKHTQDWLKRYRKAISPLLIRYYLVGEYGDQTQRPHYHAALFNSPTCLRGRTLRRPGSNRPLWEQCCPVCHLVGSTWTHGDIDLGILETSSAQYICGYVTKKMTGRDDPRLFGRHPEFARMSNRPGIGASAMHEVASQLMAFNLDSTQADVPSALKHGSRTLPLGRYLRRKLRLMIGKEENAPPETLLAAKAALLVMLENHEGASYDPLTAGFNVTQRVQSASAQKALQVEGKFKIFNRKKNL